MSFKTTAFCLLEIFLAVHALHLQKRLQSDTPYDIENAAYHGSLYVWGNYRSAATLITRRMALVAAHHVDDLVGLDPSRVDATLMLGATRKGDGEACKIIRISHHNQFSRGESSRHQNNIGVVHLAEDAPDKPSIHPARLVPKNVMLKQKIRIEVTGYGISHYRTPMLHIIQMKTISIDECESHGYNGLTDSNLCGFLPDYASCEIGDAGAPAYDPQNDYVIGIISDDAGYCENGAAMIFTNLQMYHTYINDERQGNNHNTYPSINWS